MSDGIALLHLAFAPVLLVVPLVLWWWRARERAQVARLAAAVGRRLGPLVGAPAEDAQALPFARWRAVLRAGAATALALAVLAALGPQWGNKAEHDRPPALDLVVCLDVSRSMLARDESPHRLAAAKSAVQGVLEQLPEGRVALVLFAGEAHLATPLTRDRDALLAVLAAADPLAVELGGSDVGSALDAARGALLDAGRGRGTVLLLGDGEDLAGKGDAAARAVADTGHALFTFAVGSSRGARIPVGLDGGGEAFLADDAGQPVLTRADPAALERWARLGGGAAGTGDAQDFARSHLLPRAEEADLATQDARRSDRYTWPLAVAWLLWLFELALGTRTGFRSSATRRRTAQPGAKLAVGAVGFLGVAGLAGTWADALERHRSADSRGAAAELAALVESQGDEAPPALLHDAALVALLGGQPELAAGAALALEKRAEPDFAARAALLLGAAEYGAAQNLAALAREPSSPPNFTARALERARAARLHFERAVAHGEDNDANRRNAERALRLVLELEALDRERAGDPPLEETEAESPPEPPPPPDEEAPAELPPPPLDERTLTQAELERLFERLADKREEKQDTRVAARGLRSQNVDKDW